MIYSEFRTEIADFLGWGRDSSGWTADESARLDAILKAAHNQFAYAAVAPGETVAHRWSFMRVQGSVNTVASTYLYELPVDFGYIASDLVYDSDEDVHRLIEQTTPGVIDRNRMVSDDTGQPYQFAIRSKSAEQTSEQRQQLMLYPTPDAVYTLVFYYDAKVVDLSETYPYPLGGQAHSETLLQLCRDIAASRYKDDTGGKEHEAYLRRLKASVEADRRNSPKTIGLNDDGQHTVYTRHGTEFTVSMTGNLGTG